jgi:hypothetical protein
VKGSLHMTTAAMRERLHDMITEVDDKKIESIYALFEDQVAEPYEWWEDAAFVAELDERVRRYEAGIDRAYTLDELKASWNQLEKDHSEKKK